MKTENKVIVAVAYVVVFVGIVALVVALSWGVAAFLTWLLSMCFEFEWTARVSTGVWIIVLTVAGLVAVRND